MTSPVLAWWQVKASEQKTLAYCAKSIPGYVLVFEHKSIGLVEFWILFIIIFK